MPFFCNRRASGRLPVSEEAALWLPADLDGENASRTSHNYNAVGAPARWRQLSSKQRQTLSAIARRIHDGAAANKNDYLLKMTVAFRCKSR